MPRETEEPVRLQLSRDEVDLVADHWNVGAPRSAIFLHGGGQTRHSWRGTARAVAARGWEVVSLDSRGHGESDWSPKGDYRLGEFARDVKVFADHLAAKPVVIGASLGGLTALLLEGALAPGTTSAIVLVDVIPRMERSGADRIAAFMADRIEIGFASLEEVADAVAAYNPHRPRPDDLEGLKKNLRERNGRWYWHWDPAFIKVTEGRPPSEINDAGLLMEAARSINVPLLLVRGRMSDIVSEEGAREFLAELPHVGFVDVSEAGHMVAGDKNEAFTVAVMDFLDANWVASPTGRDEGGP